MSLIRQFAIRNELLYSGFLLPNVQIFFVQKISFATFGVSIDDFLTRYAGLGYSLCGAQSHFFTSWKNEFVVGLDRAQTYLWVVQYFVDFKHMLYMHVWEVR